MDNSVQAIQDKIDLFEHFQLAFGLLALLFFALTIFFVFYFKIWLVIKQQTGAEQRKSVREQKQINAATGRLTRNSAQQLAALEFEPAETDNRRKRRGGKTSGFGKTGAIGAQMPVDNGAGETSVLDAPPAAAVASRYHFAILQDDRITHTNEKIPEM